MNWILIDLLIIVLALLPILASRKSAALVNTLMKDLILDNDEKIIYGPVRGLYRGTNQHTLEVTSNCAVLLTSQRFIYTTLADQREEIPLSDIKNVSENTKYAGQYRNGRQHLILKLESGKQIGFMLREHDQLLNAVCSALRSQK